MYKKRGLGLGLANLLSDLQVDEANLKQLPVDRLKPGKYQPRQNMNKENLSDLANSIKSHGIIQPIVVRKLSLDNYEIIAGERRWRAAQLANVHEIPAIIREIPDEHAVALSLIENIQREELNVIDTALGIKCLIDEFNMTHESAAKSVGKSRTTVTNLLRLLQLPEKIKNMLYTEELDMGHARALLTLPLSKQLEVAKIISTRHLSARSAEKLVHDLQKSNKSIIKINIDPNIKKLQEKLSTKLSAMVNINHTERGNGKITIRYNSLDELDNILDKII